MRSRIGGSAPRPAEERKTRHLTKRVIDRRSGAYAEIFRGQHRDTSRRLAHSLLGASRGDRNSLDRRERLENNFHWRRVLGAPHPLGDRKSAGSDGDRGRRNREGGECKLPFAVRGLNLPEIRPAHHDFGLRDGSSARIADESFQAGVFSGAESAAPQTRAGQSNQQEVEEASSAPHSSRARRNWSRRR